jgi:twitching motility two-component system response regulator PilH
MLKVLVIDDSFTARSIVTRLLTDRYEIIQADSGKNALTILSQGSVDIVLLDLLMPDMDGYQTLKALREHYPSIPIIILSADIQDSTRNRILAAGARAVLHKPPKQGELIETIEGLIPGGRGN